MVWEVKKSIEKLERREFELVKRGPGAFKLQVWFVFTTGFDIKYYRRVVRNRIIKREYIRIFFQSKPVTSTQTKPKIP